MKKAMKTALALLLCAAMLLPFFSASAAEEYTWKSVDEFDPEITYNFRFSLTGALKINQKLTLAEKEDVFYSFTAPAAGYYIFEFVSEDPVTDQTAIFVSKANSARSAEGYKAHEYVFTDSALGTVFYFGKNETEFVHLYSGLGPASITLKSLGEVSSVTFRNGAGQYALIDYDLFSYPTGAGKYSGEISLPMQINFSGGRHYFTEHMPVTLSADWKIGKNTAAANWLNYKKSITVTAVNLKNYIASAVPADGFTPEIVSYFDSPWYDYTYPETITITLKNGAALTVPDDSFIQIPAMNNKRVSVNSNYDEEGFFIAVAGTKFYSQPVEAHTCTRAENTRYFFQSLKTRLGNRLLILSGFLRGDASYSDMKDELFINKSEIRRLISDFTAYLFGR